MKAGELIFHLAAWTRDGRERPRAELTPQLFAPWAARRYAFAVRQSLERPIWHHRIGRGDSWRDPHPKLTAKYKRITLLHRKRTALTLFAIANAQVEAGDELFRPVAQRWADTYFALPGGDVPTNNRLKVVMDDAWACLEARMIESHPEAVAEWEAYLDSVAAQEERKAEDSDRRAAEGLARDRAAALANAVGRMDKARARWDQIDRWRRRLN